jgi:uncharacterized protein YbaR (Trm112 family)
VAQIDSEFLSLLACPEDKGPLYYIESEDIFYNPRLRRIYPIKENIPVLLVAEAIAASAEDDQRIQNLINQNGIKPTFEV